MGAAIIPVLVNAEVAALPTEVKFVKAAITGIAGLFHKHASNPVIVNSPQPQQSAAINVMADLKAVEPLLLALAKEFGGVTIPEDDLREWEGAVSDAVALVGRVHNLMGPKAVAATAAAKPQS